MKSSKVICALLLVSLLCIDSFVEGKSKFHRALKRVGKAAEKVGKKALEDGVVSKVILAGALGRKRRDVGFEPEAAIEDVEHFVEPSPVLQAL